MTEAGKVATSDVSALLMAMIDGEAGPAELARARAAIAADPGLAAEADVYRLTGYSNLSPPFDGIIAGPVPGQLIHTVRTFGLADRLAVPSRRPARASFFGGWRVAVGGLAAAAVAISVGVLMLPGGSSQPAISVAVAEGLSGAASGAERQIATSAGALKFKAVQTFRDAAGTLCREYEAQAATGPREYGVACRAGAGWQQREMFTGETKKSSQIGSASQAPDDKLDQIAEQLKAGDALSPEDENKLIAAGWKAAP